MKRILHITSRGEWERARRNGTYEPPSLAGEGFIHCSTADQVVATANAFFRGASDLVLLLIDEAAASSPVKYERPAGGAHAPDELFPHLYGPLNVDAVVRVVDFPCDADGTFTLPESVA